MSGANEIVFYALAVGVLALVLAIYLSLFMLFRMRKSRAAERPSEVGFVVDTFHELVARLKEKERELDALRERAEERAHTIEDYSENVLRSVPSGVVGLDEAWDVVRMNPAAERMLGVRAEEAAGRPFRAVTEGFPLSEGGGQVAYTAASGHRLWLAWAVTPLLDSGGRTVGRLLVFTDITELKALEAQAELRKRLSSLGEMAAGIAHELRNPMAVISGYMGMLEKRVDPALKGTVESVRKEVAIMDRIIEDFLSFARPRGLDLSEVGVLGLVRECLEGASVKEGVKVAVEVEGGLSIMADRVLMRQAFANLLQNAMDAVEAGGEVSVSARREGGGVVLRFADTGHGIPEAMAEKVFLPFYTTKEKGTGMGLALVHGIVTSHGGTVEVESGERGTVFALRLPARQGKGPA